MANHVEMNAGVVRGEERIVYPSDKICLRGIGRGKRAGRGARQQ